MDIPEEIQNILSKLQSNGYEAYIVGGCVRDFLINKVPKDWDITTNAKPEEIAKIFPKSFYENNFGTVSVITESENPALKTIEITPFRIEGKYTDKRHPDKIEWAKTLAEDLSRRDFTVNALAMSGKSEILNPKSETISKSKIQNSKQNYALIDLFDGQRDLKNQIIRAVGDPKKRFREDALRLIRAIRFATTLGPEMWQIEEKTQKAIEENSELLKQISQERIRDELLKIIMSQNGARGIELLRRLGLLRFIIPELEQGFNIPQNKHHIYQIYQHNLLALNYACCHDYSQTARIASLLHDIAKPQTRQGQGETATFHNHEIIGAKTTKKILERLKFPAKEIQKIVKLVKFHLFYYNVGEVTESSVRRLLKNVGQEDINELLQVRHADRIGSGVPKAEPYKLRHMRYLLEKVKQDPILPKMLKINGEDIMDLLKIPAGPKVGQILSYLLSQVLSEPEKNVQEYLLEETQKLGAISDKDLAELSQKAKAEVEKVETKKDEMTKAKYWVT